MPAGRSPGISHCSPIEASYPCGPRQRALANRVEAISAAARRTVMASLIANASIFAPSARERES